MARFIDEKSVYIEETVEIAEDVLIYPNVIIEGNSHIGSGTIIYSGCYIVDAIIGENNLIYNTQIVKSVIGNDNKIGPYVNIRQNVTITDGCKIRAFVELKNCVIGKRTRIPHLSYMGDAEIGEDVFIGCGVITANVNFDYDGKTKYKTIIKDNAFIGCNSNLVAPVTIGEKSVVAAGSTITEDVPANSLAIARNRQTTKEGYFSKESI